MTRFLANVFLQPHYFSSVRFVSKSNLTQIELKISRGEEDMGSYLRKWPLF